MSNYLGESVIQDLSNTPFNGWTKTDWALWFIRTYGREDGKHHKDWVIDQVCRILLDTPVIVSQASWDSGFSEYRVYLDNPTGSYLKFVSDAEEGEDGPKTYPWSYGIAP